MNTNQTVTEYPATTLTYEGVITSATASVATFSGGDDPEYADEIDLHYYDDLYSPEFDTEDECQQWINETISAMTKQKDYYQISGEVLLSRRLLKEVYQYEQTLAPSWWADLF